MLYEILHLCLILKYLNYRNVKTVKKPGKDKEPERPPWRATTAALDRNAMLKAKLLDASR